MSHDLCVFLVACAVGWSGVSGALAGMTYSNVGAVVSFPEDASAPDYVLYHHLGEERVYTESPSVPADDFEPNICVASDVEQALANSDAADWWEDLPVDAQEALPLVVVEACIGGS